MADAPVAPEAEKAIPEGKVDETQVVEPVETPVEPVKENKTYTQEDLDRIAAKIKKNARYQARKEVEAFYKGRDSRPEPEVKLQEDKPPERASFESYEDFLDAKAEYTGRKAAREERARSEQEQLANKSAETKQAAFSNFQNKVKEKYPDIEDRIEAISEISMSDSVLQAIAESDVGPDILNHFATNPKDCERIASLSPSSAIRELGKLEARFESKPEPKKTASKAPTPINPGGGGSPSDDTPKDTDSINEWMRKERARERKMKA